MSRFLISVLLTLLVGAVILAVVLAVTLGFVGVGWVVNRAFGLGLLESTAIAVAVGFGVAYSVFRTFSMPDLSSDEDWEDDEDWDEWEDEEEEVEEDEPPIVPWRRHRPTPADPEEVERSRRRKK
ncbi:MAG: hypothetical protein H8D78_05410 [Chloroflexi bacterium]|nr:hypothetical protein [Chloroflexota bacterium]